MTFDIIFFLNIDRNENCHYLQIIVECQTEQTYIASEFLNIFRYKFNFLRIVKIFLEIS